MMLLLCYLWYGCSSVGVGEVVLKFDYGNSGIKFGLKCVIFFRIYTIEDTE